MTLPVSEIEACALEDVDKADTPSNLQLVRAKYLGRKGLLTVRRRALKSLPVASRAALGREINDCANKISQVIESRMAVLKQRAIDDALRREALDVSLPGRRQSNGSLHPLTQVMHRIEDIFVGAGFDVVEGPEIETDYYNFTALNIPPDHPARAMHDTFYLDDGGNAELVLRTHTSPAQIRTMEARNPPLRVISPGRVYRRDSDMTHSPMFHQVEGLAIDRDLGLAHLKGVIGDFLNRFFEKRLAVRFRPSYFPFTEPSAEVDVQCVHCGGEGCRSCKYTGWLEVMGCGVVNPRVLRMGGVDPDAWSGYAFGFGVDRLAMLYFGVADLRQFYAGELDFLAQFDRL
ncbi:MAG: phenylalanine--tRNA ligase subunit alpha [Gammaproteobacteria bacterium]|nr:phenylalanine--tRNA ligase subunit alpha [Gammaproteobacteria bacterium]